MFSDPALARIEATIQKLRDDIQKLRHNERDARDRADRVIRRVQVDLERDLALNERRQRDLEREITRHEQELSHKRQEIEQQFTKTHTR